MIGDLLGTGAVHRLAAQPHVRRILRPASFDRAAAAPPAKRVLLLASLTKMPYRAMRCAAAAGVEVFALGGAGARGLARSRFCRAFEETDVPIDGRPGDRLAAEINRLTARWGVDLVLAGDAPATRSLIAIRDRLAARTFPMPELATFDLLNDKARFERLCAAAGVLTPETWLFDDRDALRAALAAGSLPRKAIAKPLSMTNSDGCVVLEGEAAPAAVARIDYAPILVQRFVEGEDIGASAFCRGGRIAGFVAHAYARGVYHTFPAPAAQAEIETLLRPLRVDGVFNFDMRRDRDGRIHFLECNPRIYFKIAMSMLAGINFVALGLDPERVGPVELEARAVRFPKALAVALATKPWAIERESWRALAHTLADPLPWLGEELGRAKSRRGRRAPARLPNGAARDHRRPAAL